MGHLVRRPPSKQPRAGVARWQKITGTVLAALFAAAGLYGAITDPWGEPINPIADPVELLRALFS